MIAGTRCWPSSFLNAKEKHQRYDISILQSGVKQGGRKTFICELSLQRMFSSDVVRLFLFLNSKYQIELAPNVWSEVNLLSSYLHVQ